MVLILTSNRKPTPIASTSKKSTLTGDLLQKEWQIANSYHKNGTFRFP
jgi:hypothetical protein